GHGFYAVPEVLEAEVFVGGVLIVVVVGDGNSDGACVGSALHGVERDCAAERGKKDDLAAGGFDGTDDIGGDGQVDGSARGGFALVGLDVGDFGMRDEVVSCGRTVGDKVALRADVVDDALLLGLGIDADDEAQVEVGSGGGRDGVGGVRSGLAGRDA